MDVPTPWLEFMELELLWIPDLTASICQSNLEESGYKDDILRSLDEESLARRTYGEQKDQNLPGLFQETKKNM